MTNSPIFLPIGCIRWGPRQCLLCGVLRYGSSFGEIRSMRNPHSRQKVRFVKILSLFVSLSFAQFHRATTLRTPRELPATAQTKKVLFVNIPRLYTLRPTPYALHSPPHTRKSPKLAILFAQSKIIHYLCSRNKKY